MKKALGVILAFAMVLSLPLISFSEAQVFSDVLENAVYYDAVAELSKECDLGYGDGTFRPDELITRAEFVTLLVKILKIADVDDAKLDQIFVDVPVTSWANKYITIAFDERLVDGYGDGVFNPEGNIKYEEMIKIAVSYILDGRVAVKYPDGYIDIAKKLGIADVQSGVGEDAKRWQAAMIIHGALNADETISGEIREEHVISNRLGSTGVGSGYGGGGGVSMSLAPSGSASKSISEAAPLMSMDAVYEESGSYTSFELDAEEGGAVPPSMPSETAPMPMPTSAPDFDFDIVIDPEPYVDRQISPGMLTAGEWNDNDNWDFWNKLMSNREWYRLQSKWEISTNRYVVSVSDGGTPVIGARVALSQSDNELWAAVTDNKGNAVIFANADADEQSTDFSLTIATADDTELIENVVLTDDRPFEVEMRQGYVDDSIDVMFMIDTTGSMGDELQYIKEELSDVISRITCDVRVSCNFYRDIHDEYIVRPFEFTTDVEEAVTQISKQRATGGGDTPEAVEIALMNGINEHEWNPNAKERFMFLVLDAPPHYDSNRIEKINECIKNAAEKGIRIIPVASSGVDKETEFLLRSMSITTNGTYVFLTDHSGIGNSHIEPTIGKYDVEFLNDLLVKIINDRL